MSIEGRRESSPVAKIELTPATHEDIDTYLDIDSRVGGKTYAAMQEREEAEEELARGPVYLIKVNGEVVGSVSYARKEDGSVYLSGLAVDPSLQGQGIGRNVLEKILVEVKDARKVWLVTHPENQRAISLYESLGFSITERKEDYFGDGEPRIVLTREQSGN